MFLFQVTFAPSHGTSTAPQRPDLPTYASEQPPYSTMAAAVMRAMTFGSASSPANDSGRDGSRSRSRSGSRQPQSDKEGGGEGPGAGEGEALSRTSSILCNYAPEGRPAGILIKCVAWLARLVATK